MKIAITGANGFLGSHLSEHLQSLGYNVWPVTRRDYNLATNVGMNEFFWHINRDDIIIHCAASVGGIRYNLNNPASIYQTNILMNTTLINKAIHIKKLIFVGSVCAYPQNSSLPTKESHLFQGPLEPSNEAYGMSKLAALVQLKACHQQYGLNFFYPVLANLCGPGDGGFYHPEKAHLIPNLIRQFATGENVDMFGNGELTRDMLYISDAVEAITRMIDVDYNEPVNIASGQETSIKEMVEIIRQPGQEVYYPDEPDKGEQRRLYDINRAKQVLGWQPKVDIESGLKRTMEWYNENFG